MRRAIELAARGEGTVEPNPLVGAVVVDSERNLCPGKDFTRSSAVHTRKSTHCAARLGSRAKGATLFVTLEPCCHFGKTPPCADAVIAAGVRRVVVGMQDPNPAVAGGEISKLREAGIIVEVGLLEAEVRVLTAPFRKRIEAGRPYVHAKWAMTLDGKLAARTGSSRWISSEQSRAVVQRLRGRMDGILVGRETALTDDPLLTARPPGPRTAVRIVVDSQARLPLTSQLVRTADAAPVMVVACESAEEENVRGLRERGVEVLLHFHGVLRTASIAHRNRPRPSLELLLQELGRRNFTNLLVEGGAELLGALFDASLIDAVHVFPGAKLIGGAGAKSPLAGLGIAEMSQARGARISTRSRSSAAMFTSRAGSLEDADNVWRKSEERTFVYRLDELAVVPEFTQCDYAGNSGLTRLI